MNNLSPEETKLVGQWKHIGVKIVPDEICERIEFLISNMLEKVATSDDGWDVLYRDNNDGRCWELTYPESAYHGGGCPCLTYLTFEDVRQKYPKVLK